MNPRESNDWAQSINEHNARRAGLPAAGRTADHASACGNAAGSCAHHIVRKSSAAGAVNAKDNQMPPTPPRIDAATVPTRPESARRRLLRLHVQGLQIDAECGESGVIHCAVRADQQHKGLRGRLRQHLAHAFFRAGNLCHPGQHNRALRVVDLLVPHAALQDETAWLRQCHVFQLWPTQAANGDTHYETLVIHEGVQSHQDRLTAFEQFFRGGRQGRADDAHAGPSNESAIVRKAGRA